MTILKVTTEVSSLVYNASTSLIRFLYVRSSLQSDLQDHLALKTWSSFR